MDWCIIIPILVGIISALLGYLLGRLSKNESENLIVNNDQTVDLQNKIRSLETDLANCKKATLQTNTIVQSKKVASTATEKNVNLTNSLAASQEPSKLISFDSAAAKAAFGKKIKENDLKVVEGIGPKIEGLFHNFGITTWKALGETSIEKCQEVLISGGDRFRMHKPNTWPKQAKLAAEGKWEALKKWQDELDGGKA
jgi:predicted flap endonuclease-1-like 5' DNA nuclease